MTPLPFIAALLGKRWLVFGSLLAVVAAGLGVAAYGALKYRSGKVAGVEQDRKRSDAVIVGMLADAQARLAEAQAREDAKNEQWKLRLKEAQRAAEQDREINARRLAAERAAAGELRDQLAAYAAGRTKTGPDTLAACSDRAAALGSAVAGTLLPALARCAGVAEDHAGGVRSLLHSWPVNSTEEAP